jgi:DNA-binding PadR family transcriptional regulator
VIEHPGYGYKLAQRLEDRCGSWEWRRTGVYGALDQLARENLVRSLAPSGRDRGRAAPRTIYEATPAGEDYFRAWLLEPSPSSPTRQELDLKILLSGPEFLPQLIEQTRAQEQRCIDDLEGLTGASVAICSEPLSWAEARSVLQRDAEIKLRQVRMEWLQNAREVMQLVVDKCDAVRRGGSG